MKESLLSSVYLVGKKDSLIADVYESEVRSMQWNKVKINEELGNNYLPENLSSKSSLAPSGDEKLPSWVMGSCPCQRS